MRALVKAIAITAFSASAVQGQFLLDDNFNAENGGTTAPNYTGFANWTVAVGNVDLVRSGDLGVRCFGGIGSCVDLVGTGTLGRIVTNSTYTFAAGDWVTINFWLTGNQRNTRSDDFQVGAVFSGPLRVRGWNTFIAGELASSGATVLGSTFAASSNLAGTWAGGTSFLQFLADEAGSVSFFLSGSGLGGEGPIIDDVQITRFASFVVPEPASILLTAAGLLALVGVRTRRTRRG